MNVAVATQSGKSPAGSQPMIGIVDGGPIMGESLAQRLQLEGYRTKWCRTGRAGSVQPAGRYDRCVCGARLRTCMSSDMRWRSGSLTAPLRDEARDRPPLHGPAHLGVGKES